MRFTTFVLAALTFLSGACAAPSDAENSGEPAMVHQVQCDNPACREAIIDQINYGVCVPGPRGTLEMCDAQCTDCTYGFRCDANVVPCLRENHIFRVLEPSNEWLASACEQSNARSQRCGEVYTDNCAVRSAVELPSREAYYRCVAETPCGRTPDCDHADTRGTIGTELAAVRATLCGGDTVSAYWTQLDDAEPTFRPSVVAALRECLSDTTNCWNFEMCVQRWRSAIGLEFRD